MLFEKRHSTIRQKYQEKVNSKSLSKYIKKLYYQYCIKEKVMLYYIGMIRKRYSMMKKSEKTIMSKTCERTTKYSKLKCTKKTNIIQHVRNNSQYSMSKISEKNISIVCLTTVIVSTKHQKKIVVWYSMSQKVIVQYVENNRENIAQYVKKLGKK